MSKRCTFILFVDTRVGSYVMMITVVNKRLILAICSITSTIDWQDMYDNDGTQQMINLCHSFVLHFVTLKWME